MNYYLAVDIGASSGRHILGWIEDGILKTEEVYRFENGQTPDGSGTLCWDVDALFSHVLAGMRAAHAQGKTPVAVGIDTWAVDFVLLDGDGRRIGKAVGYRDARTQGMDARVYETIPEAALYARTGIQKQSFNTIYQLMAVKQTAPQQLAAAQAMLLIPDYLHYRLTGRMATEYTNATTTQLLSPITRDWDWALIDALGYPRRLFQKIVPPGTTLGRLTPESAAQVGFDCDVIVPATHDTASAVLAVPAEGEGAAYLSSGTWSLMGVERDAADCSGRARAHNFTSEGGYEYRYRFLKNIMGLWMIQSVRRETAGRPDFATLCDRAERETIASLVDVADSRFLAPESMTEAVRDACRESGQAVPKSAWQVARVVYRSLAACYGRTVDELTALTGTRPACLHIVGGGSNADYLNRLTAEACGIPVLAGPGEATAIGNLLAQLLARGALPDLNAARACVRRSFPIRRYEAGRKM